MNSAALGNVRVIPGECNAVGSTQVWQKLQTSNKLGENSKPKLNKPKPKWCFEAQHHWTRCGLGKCVGNY